MTLVFRYIYIYIYIITICLLKHNFSINIIYKLVFRGVRKFEIIDKPIQINENQSYLFDFQK